MRTLRIWSTHIWVGKNTTWVRTPSTSINTHRENPLIIKSALYWGIISCCLMMRWIRLKPDWLRVDTRIIASTPCCWIGILIFPCNSSILGDIVKSSWHPPAVATALWWSINTIDKLLFRNVSSISGFLPISILYCRNRRKSPAWAALTLVSYWTNSSLRSQIKRCWRILLQRSTTSATFRNLTLRWRGDLIFSHWVQAIVLFELLLSKEGQEIQTFFVWLGRI